MKYSFVIPIAAAIFCCAPHLRAQTDSLITSAEVSMLDSFMFQGRFDEVKTFFALKDSAIRSDQYDPLVLDDYSLLKSRHLKPIDYVSSLATRNSEEMREHIAQHVKLGSSFEAERAGQEASESFEHFIALAGSRGRERDAIKAYHIAHFFKIKYTRRSLRALRAGLALAYESLEMGKPKEALEIAQSVALHSPGSVFWVAAMDSQKYLIRRIQHQILLQKQTEALWQKEETAGYTLHISAGSGLVRQKAIRNFVVQFVDQSSQIQEVEIRKIPASFVFGYHLALQAHLWKKFFIGGDLSYTKFSYSNENLQKLVFLDFELKQYSFHFLVQYLFRNNVGIRPYINMGFGLLRATRQRSDATVFLAPEDPDGIPMPQSLEIPSKTLRSPQLLWAFGLEYVASENSSVIIRPNFSMYHNFGNRQFGGAFSYALGIDAGIIF